MEHVRVTREQAHALLAADVAALGESATNLIIAECEARGASAETVARARRALDEMHAAMMALVATEPPRIVKPQLVVPHDLKQK